MRRNISRHGAEEGAIMPDTKPPSGVLGDPADQSTKGALPPDNGGNGENGGEEILLPQPPRRPEMQVPRWVRNATITLVVLAAVLVLWSLSGASIGLEKVERFSWIARLFTGLLIIGFPTVVGLVSVFKGKKYLLPDCGDRRCNWVGKLLNGNPTVQVVRISQFGMWFLIVAVSLPVAVSVALPGSVPMFARMLVLVFLLAIEMIAISGACIREVPSTPDPFRGIYKWFGARTDVEFNEGIVFLVPHIEDLHLVNVTKREQSIEIVDDLFAVGNADLRARMQVPYVPDITRLTRFVGYGEDEGVALQMTEVLKERLRRFVQEVPTWEVKKRTILKVVGKNLDGTFKRVKDLDEYQQEPWETLLGMRDEIYPHLIHALTGKKGMSREELLKRARRGKPVRDNHRWGIRILDLNLTTIVPTGKTRDAADRRSEEAGEQAAEILEMTTESMMAMELIDQAANAGHPISYDTALAMVMEHKTARSGHGFSFPGLTPVLRDIVTAFFARNK